MTTYKESIEELDAMVPYGGGSPEGSAAHHHRDVSLSSNKLARAIFRVITANVQSFPEMAITQEQALEDLQRNAADGDLVFLQEIADRYRPLVAEAFPSPEWEVFYGNSENMEPIAFRTSLFSMVAGRATPLRAARRRVKARHYTTYLRLTFKPLDAEFHATNLHLVAGAFNNKPKPDQAERVDEWNEGMAQHLAFVASLVKTGLPIVGGGAYNRQLKRHKSIGTEIGGKPVTYAVDKGAIDLLWVVDGDHVRWGMRSTEVYPGRDRKNAQRNSNHSARRATLGLSPANAATPADTPMPGPFELTTFGDPSPKKVDWKTRAALEEAEHRLGYPLTIVQGSYNSGGVSAPAGTHDGGGVVDLLAWDWQRKVRVLRAIGFAAWHRPAIKGLWGEHIHAVLIDHGRLSDSAARQVVAYRAGRDGLKSNSVDTFWRPSPIPVFEYPPKGHPGPAPDPGPRPEPADAAFPPKRTLDGVHTSRYQAGKIDVKAAQAAGLRWWYLKATEGTTVVDPTYGKRMRQARKAGIPVGSYHFARPDVGDAASEASFFLEHADIRAGDMLPMLDLESSEGLSPAQLTTWTGTWVATISKGLASKGLVAKPIIYTPLNLSNGFGCFLWVARYSDDFRAPVIPTPWKKAVIWQHSNGRFGPIKNVPGFGPVDVNALNPDVPLSALQIKTAKTQAPSAPANRPHTSYASRPDLQSVRNELHAAAKYLQVALEALPER